MTKQIEGVSEKIIACAKEEFLQKGYSDASLRTIAAKAGTTTGSIYSRFKDKEGLFSAIVEPAADHLVQMFLHTQEAFHGLEERKQPGEMEHYVSSGMAEMVDYIYDNFEVFELLLDASYGTKFQDFVERLVEIETDRAVVLDERVTWPAIAAAELVLVGVALVLFPKRASKPVEPAVTTRADPRCA